MLGSYPIMRNHTKTDLPTEICLVLPQTKAPSPPPLPHEALLLLAPQSQVSASLVNGRERLPPNVLSRSGTRQFGTVHHTHLPKPCSHAYISDRQSHPGHLAIILTTSPRYGADYALHTALNAQ